MDDPKLVVGFCFHTDFALLLLALHCFCFGLLSTAFALLSMPDENNCTSVRLIGSCILVQTGTTNELCKHNLNFLNQEVLYYRNPWANSQEIMKTSQQPTIDMFVILGHIERILPTL
jgi:hypothetical protein